MAFYSERPLEEYADGRQAALFEPGGKPFVRFGSVVRTPLHFLRYFGIGGPTGYAFVDKTGERIRLRRSHSIFDANTYMPGAAGK